MSEEQALGEKIEGYGLINIAGDACAVIDHYGAGDRSVQHTKDMTWHTAFDLSRDSVVHEVEKSFEKAVGMAKQAVGNLKFEMAEAKLPDGCADPVGKDQRGGPVIT